MKRRWRISANSGRVSFNGQCQVLSCTHVVDLDRRPSQPAHLLVNLINVGTLRRTLLQHGADETLDRVGVGGIRRDLIVERVSKVTCHELMVFALAHFVLSAQNGKRAMLLERSRVVAQLVQEYPKSPDVCTLDIN